MHPSTELMVAREQIATLRREVERLKLIAEYAAHNPGCPSAGATSLDAECHCGLRRALASTAPGDGEEADG